MPLNKASLARWISRTIKWLRMTPSSLTIFLKIRWECRRRTLIKVSRVWWLIAIVIRTILHFQCRATMLQSTREKLTETTNHSASRNTQKYMVLLWALADVTRHFKVLSITEAPRSVWKVKEKFGPPGRGQATGGETKDGDKQLRVWSKLSWSTTSEIPFVYLDRYRDRKLREDRIGQ